MQITLVQSEIEQALRTYVNNLINIKEGTQINIDLSAGRGADGFKATIDIVQLGDVVAPVVQTQKAETKPAAEEKPTKPEPKKDKVQTQQAEKKAEQTQTLTGAVAEAGSETVNSNALIAHSTNNHRHRHVGQRCVLLAPFEHVLLA